MFWGGRVYGFRRRGEVIRRSGDQARRSAEGDCFCLCLGGVASGLRGGRVHACFPPAPPTPEPDYTPAPTPLPPPPCPPPPPCTVYIQTHHNGHVAVAVVVRACRAHNVEYKIVSKGYKSVLKAQGLRSRYQEQQEA